MPVLDDEDIANVTQAVLSALVTAGLAVTAPGGVVTRVQCNDVAGSPVEGAQVTSTSDPEGARLVAGPFVATHEGLATCMLPKGVQYIWCYKQLVTFADNGRQVVV